MCVNCVLIVVIVNYVLFDVVSFKILVSAFNINFYYNNLFQNKKLISENVNKLWTCNECTANELCLVFSTYWVHGWKNSAGTGLRFDTIGYKHKCSYRLILYIM